MYLDGELMKRNDPIAYRRWLTEFCEKQETTKVLEGSAPADVTTFKRYIYEFKIRRNAKQIGIKR